MKKRKIIFDLTQIGLGILEWIGIYFLVMKITNKSYIWTFIIIGMLVCVVLFVFIINLVYANSRAELFSDEEGNFSDENYEYLEKQLQIGIDSFGYDYKIKIINFGLNNPAANIGEDIFISRDYLHIFQNENESIDYNLLWSLIFHEIGHAESGISSSIIFSLRPSSIMQGQLRNLLHKLALKEKGFSYYISLVFFYMFAYINLSFLFFRNDEHYANKFVCENTNVGIHLLKYYSWSLNYKKELHDIFHPTSKRMYVKMTKYFDKLEDSNIYKYENELVYEINDENITYLELLASKDDNLALSTLGHLYYSGIFVDENKEKGIEYIQKSYKLGNEKAQKFLYYYDENLIKEEDKKIDLSNEGEINDAYLMGLHEKVYYELYENWDLSIESNFNVLNDGARTGNKYAANCLIKHLLETYTYPIKAQEFYSSIINSYTFFDFSTCDWHDSISYIDEVIKIEEGYAPSIEYGKEVLLKDLDTENQLVWKYVKYVLNNSLKYHDVFKTIISDLIIENLELFNKVKEEDFRTFFVNSFKTNPNE